MVSNATYSTITAVARLYVPDEKHDLLHINTYDAWIELIVSMVDKGYLEPKAPVLKKCARRWEELLTLKYSRLN